jgi:hypothetical protein
MSVRRPLRTLAIEARSTLASDDAGVPGNARENLDVLRRFEDAEENDASAVQLAIERVSCIFGPPACFVSAICFAALWIGVDSVGRLAGWPHMEAPPYF